MKSNQFNTGTPQTNDKVIVYPLRIIVRSMAFSKPIITLRLGLKIIAQLPIQFPHLGQTKIQVKMNPILCRLH